MHSAQMKLPADRADVPIISRRYDISTYGELRHST